ncbi:MAG TPA: macrolide family glycosyltransferase [Vicinamibacterales bacterium]|nr:macrolide family glycosyltransferase [Vicinamibacterales bacterium]
MPRALFFSLPAHGHVNPSLPLAAALVSRGHEVVYWSTEAFAGQVRATGARYRPYRSAFLADLRQLPDRMDELAWLLMRSTAEVLEDLASIRDEHADYVITDAVAPWGRWIGEVLGLPVVTSVPTFAVNRAVMAYALAHGVRPRSAQVLLSKIRHMLKAASLRRTLQRQYGVRGPGVAPFSSSDLNIVYTSRYFQPRAGTFGASYEFVGPTFTHRAGIAFPWDAVRNAPVLYVSLGTLFNREAGFYRACFEAFGGLDVQVIMSIGTGLSPDALGPAPANTIVRPQVPQLEVLERAAAFVTHGGMNSVTESLWNGVPVLVIPQMSEQQIVGHRTQELGAGLLLLKPAATADALRAGVLQLLGEPAFRERARLVRDSFVDAGGAARGAEIVDEWIRGSARSTACPASA